jgi:hypothetical protein
MQPRIAHSIRLTATAFGLILFGWSPTTTPQAQGEPAPEQPRGTWTDPVTHLTWAADDSGYDMTWDEAKFYCDRLLTTAGYEWTLPTIEQLESLYSVGKNDYGYPIKGNIRLSHSYEWSSTASDTAWFSGTAWLFSFRKGTGGRTRAYTAGAGRDKARALCVRRAGQ